MAYKTFAAIYVGSSEIAMKIYEISGKKSFKKIDGVSSIIELAKDTYSKKIISMDLVRQVVDVLNGFKEKMKEYRVTDYRAYATSAVREANNKDVILDIIKRQTGFNVDILSNSEQRYINYKGLVTSYENFHAVASKNTAFLDVGAGSVQISLFDKNNLVVTENIPIGAVRIRDYLSIIGKRTGRLDQILAEFVESDIATFRNIYLNDKEIKNIIAVGEVVNALKKIAPELDISEKISRAQFDAMYQRILSMTPEQISEKYGIPFGRAALMLPNIIIYQSFLNNCKAEEMYVPNVDFCEGITASYMDEGVKDVLNHNFDEDIIASAMSIAKRYKCARSHSDQVAKNALKIFDAMKKEAGLTKRERIQLQIAALLHDCGNFINMHNGANNSYFIIANTEMIGLSHKERMEIANIAKYNVVYLPSKDLIQNEIGDCDYMTIAKLAAIVRIANVLDKSHTQKIEELGVSLKDGQLVITAKTYEDVSLEAGLFTSRADFFEEVFGVRPVLKLKRGV